MQLKTTLSVKEFRDRFSHKTSPEWAIGSQVTPEGRFPSGKSDRKSFTLRVTKRTVNPLTPVATGTIKETAEGCDLTWKVRRSNAGYGILLTAAAFAGVMTYYFGMLAIAAILVSQKRPELWGNSITLLVFALMLAAVVVACVTLVFFIPRKTRDRLTAHLRRVVGEENIR